EFETDLSFTEETPVEETLVNNSSYHNSKINETGELGATDVEVSETDSTEAYMDEMRSGTSIKGEPEIAEQKDIEEPIANEPSDDTEEAEIDNNKESQTENIHEPEVSEQYENIEERLVNEPSEVTGEAEVKYQEELNKENTTEPVLEPVEERADHQNETKLTLEDQEVSIPSSNTEALPQSSLSPLKEEKQDELVFEPFHTVDYFASQGIKVSQEEIPKDKFGKQLKSFTEWLKTMKRLPAAEIASSVEKSSEQKIEHLAADSVNAADVFTEAMAEVWLRQGNEPKAMEIYNKLILLYPSKSTYFAAKIDSLKKSS
ncbi:MAG: hypothetical protein H0V91_10670, partial [Flavisolibacter sp.]|nr:hypothetical protein [Flavisolibacter sp.]